MYKELFKLIDKIDNRFPFLNVLNDLLLFLHFKSEVIYEQVSAICPEGDFVGDLLNIYNYEVEFCEKVIGYLDALVDAINCNSV